MIVCYRCSLRERARHMRLERSGFPCGLALSAFESAPGSPMATAMASGRLKADPCIGVEELYSI